MRMFEAARLGRAAATIAAAAILMTGAAAAQTPIKAVYMYYNKPAFSIVARKSRGVSAPKDLEGKKLGAPPADGAYAQWP
ncbi:MAG: ABC transporter substrate-binding protein, partial [Xanthobacteraceae bacterium]